MKVIIAGGRDFCDKELLYKQCDRFLITVVGAKDIEIISGRAQGADRLGEEYSNDRGYRIKYFIPNWRRDGKAGGVIRNREMAKYAAPDGILIAFWDGKSRGTKNMIDEATAMNLIIKIVNY